MKINFLLPAIIATTIISCSTAYKTGQTPDDVYYSPARVQNDYVRTDRDEDKRVYNNSEDREIRRRVYNRRYRTYDDRYNYPYGYNNGYYNSYPVYGNSKSGIAPNISQPRKTNLAAYSLNSLHPDSAKSFNPKSGNYINTGTTNPVRTFSNPGNTNTKEGSGVGNFIRRVFSSDNSSNYNYNSGNSNNSSSTRSFDRSSNNNSNNSSSSNNSNSTNNSSTTKPASTSAPVRTFKNDN